MSDELLNKFKEVTKKTYFDQAKFFLNAFWPEYQGEAETVWKYAWKFVELDLDKKKAGIDLDEFNAHRFLEQVGETKSVVQLRETLRQIDLDFNKRMALIEYLLFRYKQTIKELVSRPQGSNEKELKEAEEKLRAVQDAFADLQVQLDQQQTALDAQKQAEAEQKKTAEQAKQALASQKKALDESTKAAEQAKQALESQQKAEEAVKKAEAEQRAAVDELNKQEESYKTQVSTLETKSKDSAASVVTRNKAANELAQLKGEDPLPLRKAKISQEATLRKVEKERKAAEAATSKALEAESKASAAKDEAEAKTKEAEEANERAEAAARDSEAKTLELEEQTKKVEEAVREAEAKVAEAQDYLEEVKKKGGVAFGSIWWLERELAEAKKFMPKSKQK